MEDIAGNVFQGKLLEAANVALHTAPFETTTAFAAVFYPTGLVYAKVFVPWRHSM